MSSPRLPLATVLFVLGVLVAAFPIAPHASAQTCIEDVLCVDVAATDAGVLEVLVNNKGSEDALVMLSFPTDGIESSVPMPHLGLYAAGTETVAFELRTDGTATPYPSEIDWRWAVEKLGCGREEQPYCIETQASPESLDFYLTSEREHYLTIELAVTPENGTPTTENSAVTSLPPGERILALRLERDDPGRIIRYRYTTRYVTGSMEAEHDDDYVYALPFAPGESFRLGQGPNGYRSHAGTHAWDWTMPEGTPIHAARDGIVIETVEQFRQGAPHPRLRGRANRVVVEHDDGTLANYSHLAPDGALVDVGQRVARGEQIALSGNTGFSHGPHLHFEVQTLSRTFGKRTFPLRFELTRDRVTDDLKTGRSYRAPRD